MRNRILIAAFVMCATGTLGQDTSPGRRTAPSTPGVFDYYVLSLSWSPLYCADPRNAARDPEQCGAGRAYAFVTHGLWPNNERTPHPRDCGGPSSVPARLIAAMLPIMPSPGLIRHQWRAHGTCSGLNTEDYFATVRSAYRLINIPKRYTTPPEDLIVPAKTLRQDFYESNRSIEKEAMRFDCSGRNLRELRVCLTRDLKPRACSSAVRDTCGDRPVVMIKGR